MLIKLFKNKYAFPVAVVLFCCICYQAAFRKTLLAWRLNQQFKTELTAGAGAGAQPGFMLRKQKNLQLIADRYSLDSVGFRSAVITRTALIAGQRNITVKEIPEEAAALQTSSTAVERVNFAGGYANLLRALQDMERAGGIGMVRSVKFYLPRKGGQQAGQTLEMSVYLQAIKK
ncbi:hypothetical protein GWR56_13500 [Mucilaginibacter sp. 14171R-50]|uniref:hypothetical protein n=1 Tax=Mucilaginibacter sp. 14171R-50 TaxID=2703789 RepID=UPI00138D5540|nr:hypothetical protein [Mucilaginibacter sp. 14171R-50]QHS56503.1 hypothetical protein GWR56_13500 [Mucilaginibacter sp. 14171R-50]